MSDSYVVDRRNRVVRRHERGHYDRPTVYGILDAALIAHIAYVVDGQPYCTPTAFWRDGDRLYWHGSSASRMVRFQGEGVPVCVTVTHLDALVLARSGFHHSVNYRSVMAFGQARRVDETSEKTAATDAFIERLYPGRSTRLRPALEQELKATTFISMEIEQASAKIRNLAVADDEADYALPIWSAVIPVQQVMGAIEPCPRQHPDAQLPDEAGIYRAGRRFDEALADAAARYHAAAADR